jgi:hypothetical protein
MTISGTAARPESGLGILVRRLRERGEDVADLVPPAPLLVVSANTSPSAFQNARL